MFRNKRWLVAVCLMLVIGLIAVACAPAPAPAPASSSAAPASSAPASSKAAAGKLEMFSWWTAGGEADGLNGMYAAYKKAYPSVEIVNATVAGGAGTNAKAVMTTRLFGGDPPDSFQVHAGLEVATYTPDKYLQPLDSIFASEGWDKVFPKDLLTLLNHG